MNAVFIIVVPIEIFYIKFTQGLKYLFIIPVNNYIK